MMMMWIAFFILRSKFCLKVSQTQCKFYLLLQRAQLLSRVKMVAAAEDIQSRRRRLEEEEDELNQIFNKSFLYENAWIGATATIFKNVKERKNRAPDKQGNVEKLWWFELYQNYTNKHFKSKIDLTHDTFNCIFDVTHDKIVLTPTNLKPNSTSPHR